MEWFRGCCQDDVGFSRTPWKRVWVNRCGTLGQLPVLTMNVIVVDIFLYGCYNGSTQQDRRTCEWRTALTWYTHLGFLTSSGQWAVGVSLMFARLGAETVRQMCLSLQMCMDESLREWLDGVKDGTEIRPRLMWKRSELGSIPHDRTHQSLQLISTCSAAHPFVMAVIIRQTKVSVFFWRRDCFEVWQQTLRTQN